MEMTVSPYRIKARYHASQAWVHLGRAREAKLRLRRMTGAWEIMINRGIIRDQAHFARQSMRCATLYRQIEGRL